MEPNVENHLPISTSTPLQIEGVQDQEDQEHITIQLETPECNILGVNPPPKNESTIQLQTPESDILTVSPMPENESILPVVLESPATDILSANPTPENDSEHTGSTELISDFEFPPDYFQNLTTDDTNSSDENAIDDYYEIENALVNPNLRRTENLVHTPISNYSRDTELEDNVLNGWMRVENNQVPDHGPFIEVEALNFSTDSRKPEDFFNQLFDKSMYTIMAQQTNAYAHDKIRGVLQGRDQFEQMDHYSHRQHARLGTWKNLNESDIKIFIAHLLIMSSIKKSALYSYWSTNSLTRTPFFRTYLSRNKFQDILWNFQVANSKSNPPPGAPNHDPLAKIHPLLEMCQTNFRLHYTPAKYISLDESTMAFKGHVKFLQFNPSKLNKFHIKLFMVSEYLSGYISGFSVYARKTCNELVAENATLDPYCSVTTKTALGLLQKQNYWIITEQFFFDNYFN